MKNLHAAFPKMVIGRVKYTTLTSTRDNVAHLATCQAPGMNSVCVNSVWLHFQLARRVAQVAAKQSKSANGKQSRIPVAEIGQRTLMPMAVKEKPLSPSEIIEEEKLWARAVAGLPLHAVENTDRP